MYKIGDKISHPIHGAGIIQNIETKELFDEEKSFYTIEIPEKCMKLCISTDKADEIGVRKVLGKKAMAVVVDSLSEPFKVKRANWMERTRDNEAKLASRDIKQIAEVYKELYKLDNEKGLSATEKRMYASAKRYLATEIALVNNISQEKAEEKMIKSMTKCTK